MKDVTKEIGAYVLEYTSRRYYANGPREDKPTNFPTFSCFARSEQEAIGLLAEYILKEHSALDKGVIELKTEIAKASRRITFPTGNVTRLWGTEYKDFLVEKVSNLDIRIPEGLEVKFFKK
jgi:hypothetical protein